MATISDADLNLLFLEARTNQAWLDRPVDDALLRRLYEVVRMAPTSANSQPGRLVFVRTAAGKEKLKPALSETNVAKTMAAPVSVIVAHDTAFYEKMAKLVPHRPQMAEQIAGMPAERREKMALQSSTLQAGYLILAARALGLDAGPMGGFDAEKVNGAFFADGAWKASLLINLGHADPAKAMPRAPRLEVDEACRFE